MNKPLSQSRPRIGGSAMKKVSSAPREPAQSLRVGKGPIDGPLHPNLLRKMDAWWRAANYLFVGQIYLQDNPLLKEPLKKEHVKRCLLGHWGTTPGLNFIYQADNV